MATQKEQDYVASLKDNGIPSITVSEKLTRSDREICIVYNEEEGVWYADTSIPKFWRRLEKKNWECIGTQYYPDGTVCSKSFRGTKKGIVISDPFKKREVSDEQREKVKERFAAARKDSNGESTT